EGVFTATADPRVPSVAPAREELPPYLSFAPLDNAVDALNRAAERYERAFAKAQANGGAALAKPEVQSLNATLRQSERALMSATGLPPRRRTGARSPRRSRRRPTPTRAPSAPSTPGPGRSS